MVCIGHTTHVKVRDQLRRVSTVTEAPRDLTKVSSLLSKSLYYSLNPVAGPASFFIFNFYSILEIGKISSKSESCSLVQTHYQQIFSNIKLYLFSL